MSLLKELQFHPATVEWFFSKFQEPSPAQQLGWPKIAGKEHTLILAPTGSGKTLAAFLWCIDELFRLAVSSDPLDFERNKTGVHTLYISPLKALNNDIHFNLQQPLKGIYHVAANMGMTPAPIRVAVRTGDTTAQARQSMIKKPPHILITTPESLYLLLTSERGRSIFNTLRYIIVDEIHALCNNKRGVHLSLSIERLTALLRQEPTRIGLSATQRPLERIAAYLGGFTQNEQVRLQARPVTIVDAGSHKAMNVRVISPVSEWSNLPNDTVWPQLIDLLYQLITSHRNSLIFVNMRAQTEKIARFLNEKHRLETGDENAELALAHHGSISREMRYDIEARLKRGLIPAVIATASLELGIDIGSIDLVVQIQSPTSVSSALQRIGRSGHLLHSTSNGVIIPLYQADLDDCLAIAEAMQARDIEETVIPENALDVLAQQILAEVSMRSIPRRELYRMMRGSYCYRYLSESAFNQVVEMLSGHYQQTELRALYPRLTWDRVNDVLIARKGVRLLAVSSGGTIADRGYYGVYLEGANTRLGEVEEEFVFESKVGDVFFLGNNEWRINQITRDRIMVTPLASVKPRAPFWKAEPLYREMTTSMKIGAYRQQCLQQLDRKEHRAQSDAEIMLLDYLQSQYEKCGAVATDAHIVVEYFHDSVREPHVFIHAPFGGRVLGAWATALAAAVEKRTMTQVQFTYDDEGMLFRLLDTENQSPFEQMLYRPFEELKALLMDKISQTAMFLVRFRHNATRALLLQRSRLDKRIPLWLQRLRASDLLQTILQFPDFPILMETYRDCLEDLFDINGLQMILRALAEGKITVSTVQTSSPSPMTAGLLFRFLAEQMYDYDRTRVIGHAAEISGDFLADILSRQQIPALVTAATVEAAEAFWQFTHPERRARDAEDLFEIINALAPISTDELLRRSSMPPEPWLQELQAQHRIHRRENEWLPSSIANGETLIDLLRRTLRRHGPLTLQEIILKTRQNAADMTPGLDQLYQAKEVVRGRLVLGVDDEQWCDRENFAMLYRQTIAQRRTQTAADKQTYRKFALKWHFTTGGSPLFETMVQKYAGMLFPLHSFEQDILSARFPGFAGKLEEWKQSFQDGEIHAIGAQEGEGAQYRIRYNLRGGESLFSAPAIPAPANVDLPESAQRIYRFLRENGACLHRDLSAGTDCSPLQVDEALSLLARKSMVCCDDYPTFLATLQRAPVKDKETYADNQYALPSMRRPVLPTKREINARLAYRTGRWFLTTSFAVLGKKLDPVHCAERQVRLLLQRYGVVVKEFYRRESGLLPWGQLFQVLKKMEWSGEIRRGYFIAGLSGVQFAGHEAVQLLEAISQQTESSPSPILLCTIDPALPFGGQWPWEFVDSNGVEIPVTRSAGNHMFMNEEWLAFTENYGSRIWTSAACRPEHIALLAEAMKRWLILPEPFRPRRKIEISQLNGTSAATHPLASLFVQAGYEAEREAIILWPSNIQK